jgi:hypothetical protein
VPDGQPVVRDGAVTAAVGADWTEFDPVAFVAVTVTRIVPPESAVTSVYVLWVARGIGTHAAPVASHRDHAYAKVIPVPVHVPGFDVNVCPTTREPTIVGGAVLGGPAGPPTTSVAFEATVALPSLFDPVTRTRKRELTSPTATT